jgi:hypothetical protein
MTTDADTVLVVDFGAQYAQLIARRVREARVYSEIVPHNMPVDDLLALRPKAIILSGGPASVYAQDAPEVDRRLFDLAVPTFGICYGFQVMAQALGGEVQRTGRAEFGGIWWSHDGEPGPDSWGYGAPPKSEEEWYERFAGLVNVLLGNPAMFGYCYTQLTDVYQERNGLYTFDRVAKFDVARLHQIQGRRAGYELPHD